MDRGELDPRGIESKLGRLNLQDEMSNKKRESSPHYAELKVTIYIYIWCGVLKLRRWVIELRRGVLKLRRGLTELRRGVLILRRGVIELRRGC